MGFEVPSRRGAIRFGVFEADFGSGELRRAGVRLKLQDKPFQILAALLAQPGEVVTRDALRQQLWGSDTFVDFDRSLNIAVAKLRAVLCDDADVPRYIETLPRRGYRFIGQIAPNGNGGSAPPAPVGVNPPQLSAPSDEMPTARKPLAVATTPNGNGGSAHPAPAPEMHDAVALSQPALLTAPQPILGPSRKEDRRATKIAAAAAVLALVTGALWWALGSQAERDPAILGITQITNDGFPKAVLTPVNGSTVYAVSGPTIYFEEIRNDGPTLAEVSTSGGEVQPLRTRLKHPLVRDFSTTRSELLAIDAAGFEGGLLWALKMPAGAARRVGSVVASAAAWAPDGETIAYARADRIDLCDPEGSHARELTRVPGVVIDLAWSPDGKVLRFTLYAAGARRAIWQVASNGKGLRPVFNGWRESGGQAHGRWSADGRYFIFQSLIGARWGLWALREKTGWLGREKGSPVLLSQGLLDQAAPIPGSSGHHIFLMGAQLRSEVVRYDAQRSRFVSFLGRLSAKQLDFSRDGQWLAYVSYPGGTLWRSQMNGSGRVQLAPASLAATAPRWSPDGKWIVFMGEGSKGSWQLYLVPSSGGPPRPLVETQTAQGVPTWSPDGKTIAFGDLYQPGAWPASRLKIHLYDIGTRRLSTVPGSEGLWTARWSPDGRYIAALTADNRTLMLYDVIGGKWSTLAKTNPIADLAWSRTGDSLYFEDYYLQRGIFRIQLRSRKIERVVALAGFRSGVSWWLGVAPDGSPLLVREAGNQEIYSLHCSLP